MSSLRVSDAKDKFITFVYSVWSFGLLEDQFKTQIQLDYCCLLWIFLNLKPLES